MSHATFSFSVFLSLLCLYLYFFFFNWTFPGGSVGKESACNAGDTGSIPGSGRSPGEGNGNLLSGFLPGKFLGQRRWAGHSSWGHKESDTTVWLSLKKKNRNFHLNFLKAWDKNFHKSVSWFKNWIGKPFFQCLVLFERGCLREDLDISNRFGSL